MNHALEAKIHSLCSVAEGNKHALEAKVVMETVASRASGLVKEVQGIKECYLSVLSLSRGFKFEFVCLSLSRGFKFEFEFLLKLRNILYFYKYFNKTIKLYNIYIFYYLKNVQIWLFTLKTLVRMRKMSGMQFRLHKKNHCLHYVTLIDSPCRNPCRKCRPCGGLNT